MERPTRAPRGIDPSLPRVTGLPRVTPEKKRYGIDRAVCSSSVTRPQQDAMTVTAARIRNGNPIRTRHAGAGWQP